MSLVLIYIMYCTFWYHIFYKNSYKIFRRKINCNSLLVSYSAAKYLFSVSGSLFKPFLCKTTCSGWLEDCIEYWINHTAIPYRESRGVYREIPVMKTDPCNENRGSLYWKQGFPCGNWLTGKSCKLYSTPCWGQMLPTKKGEWVLTSNSKNLA